MFLKAKKKVSKACKKLKELPEKLRSKFGRDFLLEKVVRRFLPFHPKTEEFLLQTCVAANGKLNDICKKDVNIKPEDLCILIFISFATPMSYFIYSTGFWLVLVEAYSCVLLPTMVSFYSLESSNNEKIGHLLVYWVFYGGFSRIAETGTRIRYMLPALYPLIKSIVSIYLIHPKFDRLYLFADFFTSRVVFPCLGSSVTNKERKIIELSPLLKDDSDDVNDTNKVGDMEKVDMAEKDVADLIDDDISNSAETVPSTKKIDMAEIVDQSSSSKEKQDGDSNSNCGSSVASNFVMVEKDDQSEEKEENSNVVSLSSDEVESQNDTDMKRDEHTGTQESAHDATATTKEIEMDPEAKIQEKDSS